MPSIHTFFVVIICIGFSFTNALGQTVRGTVADKDSGRPVPGAVLLLKMDNTGEHQTISDSAGVFRFDGLKAGTGILWVEKEEYAPFSLSEVMVAAGKERRIEVLLSPGDLEAAIPVVDIVEVRPLRQTAPLGEIPLSREQTLYYPMTYFDPARLAMAWPGVAQTDDGTNAMSIRGNNPAFVRWRLQGMDIVSPNHLPNAGTFSDRPSVSSGGVLMLSAQMIDNSSLITGAGTVGYNDGIGGMMDLNLRKGNDQRHEQTIQAGLTGIDAAVEGPLFHKKNGASYLINYRYSTVGILGQLGVSFGGEKINFQDLAMHFNLPTGKRGNISLFALGGKSSNIFTPPDSVAVFKDLFVIDFYSRTGIAGITHSGYAGDRFSIKTGFSMSRQENQREQTGVPLLNDEHLNHTRGTFNSSMRYKATDNTYLLFGVNLSAYSYYRSLRTFNAFEKNRNSDIIFQTWIASETSLLDGRVKFQVGINPIITETGRAIDPRLQATWRPSKMHQMVFSLASYSQGRPLWVRNSDDRFLHSIQYAARYQWTPSAKWVFSAEVFQQSITNLPISNNENDAFSVVNETEPVFGRNLKNKGTGQNTGIELMAFRRFSQSWFVNGNVTLLRSVYQGADEITRRTRWDVGHIVNLTVGKEWQRKIKKQLSARVFGVDSRAVLMGGTPALPIDRVSSVAQQTTIFDYSNGFTERNSPYFRIDGRIYWKRSIANRRNSTFALEFQNLTGQKNIAYRYYDPLTENVETKYQLGLIPNLSWRLEF